MVSVINSNVNTELFQLLSIDGKLTSAQSADVQKIINSEGYDAGPVDGDFQKMTSAGVMRYLNDNPEQAYLISPDMQEKLSSYGHNNELSQMIRDNAGSVPAEYRAELLGEIQDIVSKDTINPNDIVTLQANLGRLGYDYGPFDGEFGSKTAQGLADAIKENPTVAQGASTGFKSLINHYDQADAMKATASQTADTPAAAATTAQQSAPEGPATSGSSQPAEASVPSKAEAEDNLAQQAQDQVGELLSRPEGITTADLVSLPVKLSAAGVSEPDAEGNIPSINESFVRYMEQNPESIATANTSTLNTILQEEGLVERVQQAVQADPEAQGALQQRIHDQATAFSNEYDSFDVSPGSTFSFNYSPISGSGLDELDSMRTLLTVSGELDGNIASEGSFLLNGFDQGSIQSGATDISQALDKFYENNDFAGYSYDGVTETLQFDENAPVFLKEEINTVISENVSAYTLSAGDTEILQQNLNALGYEAGPVDGDAGPKTFAGIDSYLSDNPDAVQEIAQRAYEGDTASVTAFTESPAGGESDRFDSDRAVDYSRVDNAGGGYCAQGVANILKDQGIPCERGHAYTWDQRLERQGWQRLEGASPETAPEGSVLYYDRTTSAGVGGGAQYGHVEVVATNDDGDRSFVSDKARSNWGGTVPQNYGGAYVHPSLHPEHFRRAPATQMAEGEKNGLRGRSASIQDDNNTRSQSLGAESATGAYDDIRAETQIAGVNGPAASLSSQFADARDTPSTQTPTPAGLDQANPATIADNSALEDRINLNQPAPSAFA